MNKQLRVVSALLVSVFFTACGGGSSSSNSAPNPSGLTASMSTSNYSTISSESYSSGLILDSFVTIATAAGVQASPIRSGLNLRSLTRQLLSESMLAGSFPAALAGVVTNRTVACSVSGNYTVTFNDADNSTTFTAGDSVTSVYSGCVTSSAAGNFTRNGTAVTSLTRVVGDFTNQNSYFELTGNLNFQNLAINLAATTSTPAVSLNMLGNIASATVNNPAGTSTDTTTIPALTVSSGSDTLIYANYQLNETTDNVAKLTTRSGQGTFTDSSFGSVALATAVPFQGAVGGNPSTGRLRIEGANAFAYVTAIDAFSARLELDLAKDGTIDTSQAVAWSAITF